MPVRPLPDDPSLEHLRKQAKRLRNGAQVGAADALAQLREFHPRATSVMARVSLSDAQLVIARSYGFASWTRLKRHIAAIEPFLWNTPATPHPAARTDVFIRLACLVYGGWDRAEPGTCAAHARRGAGGRTSRHLCGGRSR